MEDMLGYNYDIDLYDASMQKMSMDALRRGMTDLVESNFENIWEGVDICDGNELVSEVVDDLATEAVLEYINNHLKIMPVAEFRIYNQSYIDFLLTDEMELGHHIEIIPKLYNKPVVLLGEIMESGGLGNLLFYSLDMVSFLAVDGLWHSALRRSYVQTAENNCDHELLRFELYEPIQDGTLSIEKLADIIPDKYEFLLYGFA